MRITDNEGFDMFFFRDEDLKKEENIAKEKDAKKTEKQPENESDVKKQQRTVEKIKIVLLVMILITSSVTMIFAISGYYKQTGEEKLVFLENVIGKTDNPGGTLIVDVPDDEIQTTQGYVNLPPDIVQQQNNDVIIDNNSIDNNKVVSETTTVAENETTTEKSGGKININSASREQLMTLEGIGQVKADAIIEYRIENGAFLTIEELTEVKGIGEGILEKNRHRITVDH